MVENIFNDEDNENDKKQNNGNKKEAKKKTESFASIFGDDFEKSPPDKQDGPLDRSLEAM